MPADPLQHRLIGHDRDDTIECAFARTGFAIPRSTFALRTDDQLAYGQVVATGAGIGFVAHDNSDHWPRVEQLLSILSITPLPRGLAVHREIRADYVVRRVYDFLPEAIPRELQRATFFRPPSHEKGRLARRP